MNILVVHNYYRIPGGEDTVVRNEIELLKSHGHEVTVYTRSNSEFAHLQGIGKLRKLAIPFVTIYNPKTSRDITSIIREKKIDVVHVHNTLNLISPSVYYAARRCKVPVVQTIHNFRLLCPGATFNREMHVCEDCVSKGLSCALKHKCYRGSFLQTLACVLLLKIHRSTGIYGKINYICLTEFNREKLLMLNHTPGGKKLIDEDRVFVKPNSATGTEISDTGTEILSGSCQEPDKISVPVSEISVPVAESYVLYAGRLDELKGVDFLVDAWTSDMPKLIICGTGPLEKCTTEKTAERSNIEFRGFVDHEEVMKLISGAAAMILPTRWYEGFPMTVVESYSTGTPVIGSDIGNTGSLIEDGVTGHKFTTGDANALKDAVDKVMEAGEGIRKSTREMFDKKYTPEKNYELLMDIYSKAK